MSDKNTIVTTYGESIEIMNYMDDFCGCCRTNFYNEWYEANEAYFVRQGIFVLDDLMYMDFIKDGKESIKPVRYCFKFDKCYKHQNYLFFYIFYLGKYS